MSDQTLRDQINKRFTLNWLIQGAAQHAGMTFHHLVRDELDALDPRLVRLYDQFALINLLQYWNLDSVLLFGWPPRFWRRASSKPSHPFFGHPLLSKFGGMLAACGRERAIERSKEKGVTTKPLLFSFQVTYLIGRLRALESRHRPALVELAKRSASTIWGIPVNRLNADLSKPVPFGTPIRIRNQKAAFFRACTVGLGGVVQAGDSLLVVGMGTNWQLLTKELVKGTAELICLHGLNHLSEETYLQVVDAADRIEYEPWMLQTGGELWRRLLAVVPDHQPIAEILMHIARLPPDSLHSLIEAVIEKPDWAKEILASFGNQEALTARETSEIDNVQSVERAPSRAIISNDPERPVFAKARTYPARTIKWEESWSVRRLAYGRRYISHLLHILVIWGLWLLVIGMLVVDPSLRSRERASRIGVLVLGGTLYRLCVETLSRKIRWSDEGFFVGHIGKFDCPLSAISDLQFTEIDDEWSRAEFYATKKFGRRKKYVMGIPRTAVAKLKALFGLESDFDFSSDEAEENKPSSMRSMAHSAFFFDLYWKILGWIMICGAVITGVDNIVFAKDMKTALEGEAVAVFGGLIGVAVMRQKTIMRWYLRILTGKGNQGDDRK